jgi:hypothetical protein
LADFFIQVLKFKKIIGFGGRWNGSLFNFVVYTKLKKMSLKILSLQLTGKIQETGKVESNRKSLQEDYQAFRLAEESGELKEYRELELWIKSGACDRKKKEMESLVFKGSLEYNQLKEFKSLNNNKSIKNFFSVESSDNLRKFRKVEVSADLKKYWELKDYVKDGEYQQEKKEILAQKFEGSTEQSHLKELAQIQNSKPWKAYRKLNQSQELKNHLLFQKNEHLLRFYELKNAPEKDKVARKEFKKLKIDSAVRAWFKFENSKELKYYHEMDGSHTLSRVEELVKMTESDSFKLRVIYLKDKKKLEKSEAWKKMVKFRELASNDDVRFFLKFEKSSLFKNYLDTKDTYQLKRFHELKELTLSSDFLKRKATLEDTKKWEKTEEFARQQRFLQLKKHPKIELYFKYCNSHAFDFQKKWEISFEDHFDGKSLDAGKWTANTYWADRLVGGNFSQAGDLQAYSGGKNCHVGKSMLSIQVKKEKAEGKRWVSGQGFIPDSFDYTSDSVSTIKSFWQKEGIFEAKIRFNPVKQVVQSCHLLGEGVSPQITLVEAGPKSRSGILSFQDGKKPEFSGIDLKNLRKDKFYIFTLEWENNHFTWKINDRIIFEIQDSRLKEQLHLNLACLVVNEVDSSKIPVAFETDWIRCYRKKE